MQKLYDESSKVTDKRALERGVISQQLKLYEPFLKSFADVIKPMLTEDKQSALYPLICRQAHCDGILIPKYSFNNTGEAKALLRQYQINVDYVTVTSQKDYFWTRSADNSLDLSELVIKLTQVSAKMREDAISLMENNISGNLPKDVLEKTVIHQLDIAQDFMGTFDGGNDWTIKME